MGTLTQTQEGLKFTGTLTNIQAGDTTVLTIKANGDLVPTGIIPGYATETYVGTAISNLIDSSPAALNTLNELAAALGDDASFSTTVTTSIGTKLPLAGGALTGGLTISTPSVANGGTIGANILSITGTSQVTSTNTAVTPTNTIVFKPAMSAGYGNDGYNTVLEQISGGARILF